jgi:hypothetical protein
MEDGIEFSFPDDDLATAGQHAQELRAALIAAGVPADDARLKKASADTMDLGSMLVVAFEAVTFGAQVAKPYVEFGVAALSVYAMLFRDRCTLKLKTKAGELLIRPGELTAAQLKVVLAEAFRVNAKR